VKHNEVQQAQTLERPRAPPSRRGAVLERIDAVEALLARDTRLSRLREADGLEAAALGLAGVLSFTPHRDSQLR
jgi:hypothetical protein